MDMAKRQREDFGQLRHRLEQLAIETGALRYDGDADKLVSRWNGDAESRTYAQATLLHRRCKLGECATSPEVRELLKDILDGTRFGNRNAQGPQRRETPRDVIGSAVQIMRIATGDIRRRQSPHARRRISRHGIPQEKRLIIRRRRFSRQAQSGTNQNSSPGFRF